MDHLDNPFCIKAIQLRFSSCHLKLSSFEVVVVVLVVIAVLVIIILSLVSCCYLLAKCIHQFLYALCSMGEMLLVLSLTAWLLPLQSFSLQL